MAVITVTKDNFEEEVVKSERPVLVDFWASWCGPCKMLSPIVDEVSDQVEDVKICKINVDEEMELARKFRVMSIPTLVFFKDGEAVSTNVGLQSKEDIIAIIEK